jgi:integrase
MTELDSTKVLTKSEVATVWRDLDRKAKRFPTSRANQTLFTLATFAGLRASELCGLTLGDVDTDSERPTIRVRKEIAKGEKARSVPLWDLRAIDVLRAWKSKRIEAGANDSAPFIATGTGKPLTRQGARNRFKTACKCLGVKRRVTIHHGRHTFVSLSLAAGVDANSVRRAAGHSSLHTTSIYAHLIVDVSARDLLAS